MCDINKEQKVCLYNNKTHPCCHCHAHYALLNNKARMPLLGLGTWKAPKGDTRKLAYHAIKQGYRLIDGAAIYGNEDEVGAAVAQAVADELISCREEMFITSKLWNCYHEKKHVREACEKTLEDLKMDYVDLYLMHFPIATKFIPFSTYPPPVNTKHFAKEDMSSATIRETWEAMEKLVDDRLCKAIGVSNFTAGMLIDLLKYARIKPAVNQIEHHLLLQQPGLIEFCKVNDIVVTAYSSFGKASYESISKPGAHEQKPCLLTNPTVVAMAKKYNITTAQLNLRWAIQRDIAVIPMSSKAERITENMNIFKTSDISEHDLKVLENMDSHTRFNDPKYWGGIHTAIFD